MTKKTAKTGRSRRTPLYISVKQLFLDPENPRLPKEAQGKSEGELLEVLFRRFNLEELAYSMAENGYFDEEPLVVIPQQLPKKFKKVEPDNPEYVKFIGDERTKFTVVEGNRRVAAAKLLLDQGLRKKLGIKTWPKLSKAVAGNISQLPAIVYSKRREVVSYLGVRHLIGIQKWESYAKARYIASMAESGADLDDIQAKIGDRKNATRLSYICYKILEQAKDILGYDITKAQNNFSFLILSMGGLRNFLGMPRKLSEVDYNEPVPKDKMENLHFLLSCLYGDKGSDPLIEESRDITDYLKWVLNSDEAYEYLKETGDLKEAYEYTAGEETYLHKALATANKKLDLVLGKVHRHRDKLNIREEIEKASQTIEELLKRINN